MSFDNSITLKDNCSPNIKILIKVQVCIKTGNTKKIFQVHVISPPQTFLTNPRLPILTNLDCTDVDLSYWTLQHVNIINYHKECLYTVFKRNEVMKRQFQQWYIWGRGWDVKKRLISMLLAYLNSSLVQMFKQYRTDHKPKV